MPGTSVSQTIWFIASIVVAAGVGVTLATIVFAWLEGVEDANARQAAELSMSVEFINDPSAVPYDPVTGDLTLYLKNTGSRALNGNASLVTILVNGAVANVTSTALLNGAASWVRTVTLEVHVVVPGLVEGTDYTIQAVVHDAGYRPAEAITKAHMECRVLFV